MPPAPPSTSTASPATCCARRWATPASPRTTWRRNCRSRSSGYSECDGERRSVEAALRPDARRVAKVAREEPRPRDGDLARLSEKEQRRAARRIQRCGRRGARLRLDRRDDEVARREPLHAAFLTAKAEQQLVGEQ